MKKFIKIFHRIETVETDKEVKPIGIMNDIVLKQIVGCSLTNKQFEDLAKYFEDNVFVAKTIEVGRTISFDIRNTKDLLENSPLPNGVIINDSSFEDNGRYLVILGHAKENNEETKVGLIL